MVVTVPEFGDNTGFTSSESKEIDVEDFVDEEDKDLGRKEIPRLKRFLNINLVSPSEEMEVVGKLERFSISILASFCRSSEPKIKYI